MNLRDGLQDIYDRRGELTPELLVQEARPKGAPLHDIVFDRPPKEAAEAYYRNRAHELIQSVKVIYREADESGSERSVRAFHAVRKESGYVYEPVEKVAADPFTRRLLLSDMEREWKTLYSRYEQFEEFLTMVRADLMEAA